MPPADRPPFETVLNQHQGMVRHLAEVFHVPNRAYPDVDDLYQEGCIALWRAYESCRDWKRFPTYARKVVYHALVDAWRREFRPHGTHMHAAASPSALAAPWTDPALRLLLREILLALPAAAARDFWAVEVLGWSVRDWAKFLGHRRTSVSQSLRRARRAVRQLWNTEPARRRREGA